MREKSVEKVLWKKIHVNNMKFGIMMMMMVIIMIINPLFTVIPIRTAVSSHRTIWWYPSTKAFCLIHVAIRYTIFIRFGIIIMRRLVRNMFTHMPTLLDDPYVSHSWMRALYMPDSICVRMHCVAMPIREDTHLHQKPQSWFLQQQNAMAIGW